jgi:cyclophilin family peptidyl-prolyl cis-trans isomerase/HEAT repeat protein
MQLGKNYIKDFLSIVLLTALCLPGCLPVKEEPAVVFEYEPLRDSIIHKMISWQEMGLLDSINTYLTHDNPAYRYQAAKAYCSPTNKDLIKHIFPLLQDTIIEVAEMAAYACGQAGSLAALPYLTHAFDAKDSSGYKNQLNANVLEAVGKCGRMKELDLLTSISTYGPEDTLLLLGQTRGLFRLLLNNYHNEGSVNKILELISNEQNPRSVRQLAAYYLARGRKLNLSNHAFEIKKTIVNDNDPIIRAYLATAIGNSKDRHYAGTLADLIKKEEQPEARINIFRAYTELPPSNNIRRTMMDISRKDEPVISNLAAQYFIKNGTQEDAASYWDLAKSGKYESTPTLCFAAATVKNLPFYYTITRGAALRKIRSLLQEEDDPYRKAEMITILEHLQESHEILISLYQKDSHPVVKTQVLTSLHKIANVIDQASNRDKRAFYFRVNKLFDQVLQDGDIGSLAAMSTALKDTENNSFLDYFRKQEALKSFLAGLKLPAEMETYNEIVDVLRLMGDEEVTRKEAREFAAFDIDAFRKLNKNSAARVETNRGLITIRLLPDISPVSVVNFVKLAKDGYFNDKIIHRVVPNFVIQTGCPRGDGYGSLDYTIRSELAPAYYDKPGMVGMASAGIDTECSQWFITYLPTPHLDGRYTIFGEVISDMEVMNRIQKGDQIKSVKIINILD